MLQYVQVNFEEARVVFIDGVANGNTNKILRVDEATYEFTLGGLQNYQPASVVVQVTGTNAIQPLQINFSVGTPSSPSTSPSKAAGG